MRISAKGRYALAAMVGTSESYTSGEYTTVIGTSERLGVSKIYPEQVLSLLKRGGLVNSIKEAQGGYQLSRMPRQITVYQVLSAVKLSLFEPAEDTVVEKAPGVGKTMRLGAFEKLDKAITGAPPVVTLADLAIEAECHRKEDAFMFYIQGSVTPRLLQPGHQEPGWLPS